MSDQIIKIKSIYDLVKCLEYLENKDTINNVCDDVLIIIFNMLDTQDRLKARLVCRKWNQIIRHKTPIIINKKRYFTRTDRLNAKKIFTHPHSQIIENPKITHIRLTNRRLMKHIRSMSFQK